MRRRITRRELKRPLPSLVVIFFLSCVLSVTPAPASLSFITIDAPGATATSANGINSAGQVVGGGGDHGYLRAAGGTFTAIDVPGATWSVAFGINDAGQIVGNFTDASARNHGYLRTAGGTFTTIDVSGATLTRVYGINKAGQIVGSFLADAGRKRHGFVTAR